MPPENPKTGFSRWLTGAGRRALTGVVVASALSPALADTEFYGGADLQYGMIGVGGETFNPVLLRADAGLWLRKGIGAQIGAGASVSDDGVGNLSLDVPSVASLSLRFQSPEDLGMKAFALLGYSRFELDGALSGGNFPGRESFTGPSASLGLLWPLGERRAWSLSAELAGYFADNDVGFGGLSLGLRYGY